MTVSNSNTRRQHLCDGVATVFSYNFLIYSDTHLVVEKTLIADGTTTTLTRGVHYTVSGVGDPMGGNITILDGPYANTYRLTIRRVPPRTQLTDYISDGAWNAERTEQDIDLAVMLAIYLEEVNARTLKFPSSDPDGYNSTIPGKENRLGRILGFDATTGDPVVTDILVSDLNDLNTYVNQAISSATAAQVAEAAAEAAQNASEAARDLSEQYRDEAQAAVGGVNVTVADTTARPLDNKLTVSGPLAKAVGTPGGDETLALSVQADSIDTSYVDDEIKAAVALSLYVNAR